MACSKLFSGDLPELTHEIIKYFWKDYSTLYSCILVNRLWCRLAIPLLWEDPFSIQIRNQKFIEIYLRNSNEDDKAKFNEYGINNNLSLSNTLFNYPSFIKCLNTHKVGNSIDKWLEIIMDDDYNNYGKREKAIKFIYRLLFKMFVENEGNLHSFEVKVHTVNDYKNFNDTMDLTLQNPNFTYNIRNLTFYIYVTHRFRDLFPSEDVLPFLKFLHSNCNSISTFYYGVFEFNADNFSLIGKCLSQIITSQQNLKKIIFQCNTFLYNSFSLLKNSNSSNTLKMVIFYSIDLHCLINIIQEVFNQLNVLESISILYCRSLNSEFVQQIINVTKSFKLKSLIISEILQVESLQLLLQKFGDGLENFGFGNHYELISNELVQQKQKLFESILKYCTKIQYFDLGEPDKINIYAALNLIENIKQNLNYLNIEFDVYEYYISYNDICSIILKNLGQILPPKLELLRLCLMIKPNDLKIFLENSQNTFIKRLYIRNIAQEGEDILPFIKEYIMKKKKVDHLAISSNDFLDLTLLKDEVDEFKLYNIKIQKYEEYYIHLYDLVNTFI
jgi:hypothetical protein